MNAYTPRYEWIELTDKPGDWSLFGLEELPTEPIRVYRTRIDALRAKVFIYLCEHEHKNTGFFTVVIDSVFDCSAVNRWSLVVNSPRDAYRSVQRTQEVLDGLMYSQLEHVTANVHQQLRGAECRVAELESRLAELTKPVQ